MENCPECGAFFTVKCEYCGYRNTGQETCLPFVNLRVKGTMNSVNVRYGTQTRKDVNVEGTMSNSIVIAERINVLVKGTMNTVTIDTRVKYVPVDIRGTMNEIR